MAKNDISAELGKEMYEALKGMGDACDEYAIEFIQHKGVCDWGLVNEAFMARTKALRAYEEAVNAG